MSVGDDHVRRLSEEARVGLGGQATLPCRKSRFPGRRVRASTANSLESYWSEVSDLGAAVGTGAAGDVLVAKERLSSEISASATRWVFVLLSARAALKACLARKMESWTLRRAALSDAAMAAFVDAVGGLRGFGSVGGGASGR